MKDPIWFALPLVVWMPAIPWQPTDQTDLQGHESRKALAAKVQKAHRGDKKTAIDRYRAALTIQPIGKAKDNINVDLKVNYGRRIERAKGVTAEMIRYSVNEGDKPMARGKDPRPWIRVGKEVHSVSSRHYAGEGDILNGHTRLCRQMLQFLDAGAIIAALEGKEPVTTEKLPVGPGKKIDTEVIRGKLSSFPVFREKKVGSQAVFMQAHVAKDTGRLAAVRVFPLTTKGKPDRTRGELIMLQKYVSQAGTLVPRELLIYNLSGGKRPVPQVRVRLTEFELNAALTKKDFARPR